MKKIMFFIVVVSFYLTPNLELTSQIYDLQDDGTYKKHKRLDNKIGFTYSMMTGYGLTYYRQINELVGLKSQFFAYGRIEDNPSESYDFDRIHLTLGSEIQFNLKKFDSSRLYLLTGGFYRYLSESDWGWDGVNFNKDTRDINLGLGFGFEFMLDYNFSIAIDGGYHFNFSKVDSYDRRNNIMLPITTYPKEFSYAFGVSLYYNF
jgi:hypothetical protein